MLADSSRFQANGLLTALLLILAASATAGDNINTPMTAAEDHQRMMRLLGIGELRRGADGDPESSFAANYDESKANQNMHSLPDPLEFDDGTQVVSATDWWKRRRPEIVEHFDREIYGRVPAIEPRVTWRVVETTAGTAAGRAIIRQEVRGSLLLAGEEPPDTELRLSLTYPGDAPTPVPVVLELSFAPEVLKSFLARFTEEQIRAFGGGGTPWTEQVTGRGWAHATLVATSVQADSGDGLAAGVIGLSNRGGPRSPEDWGALRAWAWGLSRVIDYFETSAPIDAQRVAVTGHSRFGKAALLAMAYDRRIAAGFISSSGEGGAKLWRRDFGEKVGNIAGTGEYHWVAGNFLKYAGPLGVNDLPVDAHHLIALCAPRPVFISSGTEGDQWVDPRGMFLAAAAASQVYELLGADGLEQSAYPPVGEALTGGDIAWRQHPLGHSPGPNWPYFLDFAARYFTGDEAD